MGRKVLVVVEDVGGVEGVDGWKVEPFKDR